MPTNLEYKGRKRKGKREVGGKPAKVNVKKGDRDLEREIKKTKKTFFC